MQPNVKRWLSAGALTGVLGIAVVASGIMSVGTAAAAVPQGNACQPNDGKIEGRGSIYQGSALSIGGSQGALQNALWAGYNAALCGNTPTSDTSGDNMGTYNYTPPLTWNADGLVATNCRTDAYAGTDLPYTNSQLVAGLDGPPKSWNKSQVPSGPLVIAIAGDSEDRGSSVNTPI